MENTGQYESVRNLSDLKVGSAAGQGTGCVLCGGVIEKCVGQLFDTRFGIEGNYEAGCCLSCGLEQLVPLPTPAKLKSLYEAHYNFGGERETVYVRAREWFFSSWLYRAWIRLDGDVCFHTQRAVGRLLDVGCNEGRGLKIYARNGLRVEGLELNQRAAATARESGFTVHNGDLCDLQSSLPFDVVVLSNVLEHSLNPRQMLRDVYRNRARVDKFGSVAQTATAGCAQCLGATGSTGTLRFMFRSSLLSP